MSRTTRIRRAARRLRPRPPTSARTLDRELAERVAEHTKPRPAGAPPPLSSLDPAQVRTADVAVVLGSGPSARVVEDPAVGRDPGLDFFALNHAAALPVASRMVSIEEPVLKGRQSAMTRDDAVALLLWSLRHADALSGSGPIVIRGDWDEPTTRDLAAAVGGGDAPVIVSDRFALGVEGPDGPRRYAEWARERRPFRWPVGDEPVLSPRGGLGFLVSLCIALGYPTIVLAGVDMVSDEYFFDRWDDDPELDRLRSRLLPASAAAHVTSLASGSRPSVATMLVALDRWYLRPEGRRLRVASASSLLHPDLDLHEW